MTAGQRRALVVLPLGCFLCMTAWFSAAAVMPALGLALRFPPADGAFLTMAVQLGFVTGAVLSALLNLSDLYPPRRLIFLGALAAAAANLGLLAAPSLAAAVPFRFVVGVSLALVYPPFLKVADQAYVGTAVTMQLALGFLLTNVTLWGVPVLAAHCGWGVAFLALAPGPAAGIASMARLRRIQEI